MGFRGVYEPMFLLHSFVDGHLGGIHLSVIGNRVWINMTVHVSQR